MVSNLAHPPSLSSVGKLALQDCLPGDGRQAVSYCGFRGQRMFPSITISRKSSCIRAATSLQAREQALDDWSCNSQPAASYPDRWVEESVTDIVKNINEAPFLHLLYDSEEGRTMKFERQIVRGGDKMDTQERWKEVKEGVRRTSPDGVILVQQLDEEGNADANCAWPSNQSTSTGSQQEQEKRGAANAGRGRLWGVLVLGRNAARCACYILETTSVTSTFGRCTRFSLTKAHCGGVSILDQVQKSWLQS